MEQSDVVLAEQEICSEPRFYVDGASRLDIKQGVLGNCWLLAAMSVLAQHKPLVDRIMPEGVYEADRFSPRYTGKVVFKLWQYGEWVTVIIDDRLPTYKGKLVFVHSPEKNEFWCALLEKAYAKIHGSYEALKGGLTGEALEDFTGGLSEVFVLEDAPANLFQIMQRAEKRSALMGCSINVFLSTRGGVELIRIRNPWGDEKEWTGAWGDRSPEWQELSQDEKRSLDLEFDVDGEFWMSFEDFKSHFDKLEVCMLDVENAIDKTQISFNSRLENGFWRKHVSAGGCRNFLETFHTNPQFRLVSRVMSRMICEGTGFALYKVSNRVMSREICEGIGFALYKVSNRVISKVLCEGTGFALYKVSNRVISRVICEGTGFALYKVSNRVISRVICGGIGFALYKIDDITKRKYGVSRLDKEYFQFNKSTERSTFINSREVVGRFELAPGEYVIVPSTFIQNAEADFLLRIFSEKAVSSSALTESTFFGSLGIDQVDLKDMNDAEKFRVFFDKFAGEAIFKRYDIDESGSIEAFELRQALFDAYPMLCIALTLSLTIIVELSLSQEVLQAINARFSTGDGKINVDDFVEISCRFDRFYRLVSMFLNPDGSSITLTTEQNVKRPKEKFEIPL
ncbi:predicted protein [Nematostella vectensis]|uniref:Uncharacterized protein n=1 Tax=Nematostella vectensis TaxID=45351 RepID=A7RJ84_NEMVE|nr:predicted protein [Nematostella vectensis]|eukprot:XP_001640599.1 predicted protein [Nematostella vectensis]